MVVPIDVKPEWGASVGFWINYVTLVLASPMTLTLDFARSNFKIAVSQEWLVGLMWSKKEVNQILNWLHEACPLTTYSWSWSSRSVFEIALSQEWKDRLARHERDGSCPFTSMTFTFVWPYRGGWMYQIVTGVPSDVWVPSTYLVIIIFLSLLFIHLC